MRTVAATRYVTPLREGGSLPAVIEADDDGLYVLKFRGAGQGAKALVAELVAGELARALDLPIPEIVLAELDPELARTEPDPEIQDLIRASAGLNLALDYLPGAVNYDPVAEQPDAGLASRVVWFDAFVSNVDRSFRNTNLLVWHRRLWLIDHGAALYFHHGWDGTPAHADSAFPLIKDHVLLPLADALVEADAELAPRLDRALFESILAQVPESWLDGEGALADPAAHRAAYVEHFVQRLAHRQRFVEEAIRARA
ncbi:HipA family kinase [Lysobacter cavernae]|uniref:HipA family kinase n=1 Tax=Lysobacter cavernae TaxID=1685901 RepID=A0ABV7RR39_9GAMM